MEWPLVLHLGTTIPHDRGDPLAESWEIAWGGHALAHQPLDFFGANQFWPFRDTLAFSDALVGYAPAGLLGSGPEAAVARYDLGFLFAYVLAFLGGYLLARELGAGPAGASGRPARLPPAPLRLGHRRLARGDLAALAQLDARPPLRLPAGGAVPDRPRRLAAPGPPEAAAADGGGHGGRHRRLPARRGAPGPAVPARPARPSAGPPLARDGGRVLGPAVDLPGGARRQPGLGRRHGGAPQRADAGPGEDALPRPLDRGAGRGRPGLGRVRARAAARPRHRRARIRRARARLPHERRAALARSDRLRAAAGVAGNPHAGQAHDLRLARPRPARGRRGRAGDRRRGPAERPPLGARGAGCGSRRRGGDRGPRAAVHDHRRAPAAERAGPAALDRVGARAAAPPARPAGHRQPPLPALVHGRLPAHGQRQVEHRARFHQAPDPPHARLPEPAHGRDPAPPRGAERDRASRPG